MAYVGNVGKTSTALEALKIMNTGFLTKPIIKTSVCQKTKYVFKNGKDHKPFHPLLGVQHQLTNSNSCRPDTYIQTANFHHLAENALLAWAARISNRNLDIKLPGTENLSGMRNYAKDVDSDSKEPVISVKKINAAIDDSDSAARFAEAKRILRKKRIMSKILDHRKRSPFEQPSRQDENL